jgi:putative mRNA 3-end processing factor
MHRRAMRNRDVKRDPCIRPPGSIATPSRPPLRTRATSTSTRRGRWRAPSITHGHGDHARPGHEGVLATPETLAIMRARFGEDMPADMLEQQSRTVRNCEIGGVERGASRRPAIAGLGAGSAGVQGGSASSCRATTSAAPIRPARRSSRCPATCSSPKRPSACRSSAIRRSRRDRQAAAHRSRRLPRALPSGRRLCAGQVPAGDRRAARGGLRPARSICTARMERLCELYQRTGRRPGRAAPGGGPRDLAGRHRVCARPRRARRPLVAALPDPGRAVALRAGCACAQRARQRGVELPLVISDHADWDELLARPWPTWRARGVGHARPRGSAGPRCTRDGARRPRAAPRGRSRRRIPAREGLRPPARRLRSYTAVAQRQAGADEADVFARASPIPIAAGRWRR